MSVFLPEQPSDRETREAGEGPEDDGPRCQECGFHQCECEPERLWTVQADPFEVK